MLNASRLLQSASPRLTMLYPWFKIGHGSTWTSTQPSPKAFVRSKWPKKRASISLPFLTSISPGKIPPFFHPVVDANWPYSFPVALNFNHTPANIAQYISQPMRYGGPEWNTLVDAIKDAGLYASIGFSNLDNDAIHMGQVLVGPDGQTLQHHRKVRPSGAERNISSDGDLSSLTVVSTEYGRIGQLDCYE